MRVNHQDLVAQALRRVEGLLSLSLSDWDLLVRQSRKADLLARISAQLKENGLYDQVPAAPRAHLDAAHLITLTQHEEVRREVEQLRSALAPLGVQIILLKGAAYLMAGLPSSCGRLFTDVDIMVPKQALGDVEASLMLNGWATTHHSAYDQRYYRQWMHELPPLQHRRRHTVVDVHHAILPETARLRPDPAKLLRGARPVDGQPGMQVLGPVDMVLHSMTHLFHNEEMSHGLRDLSDLDILLRHFGRDQAFWLEIAGRAKELNLLRPLYYGLRHARNILGTPIPEETIRLSASSAPAWPLGALMDLLWSHGLRAPHVSTATAATRICVFLLYVRAHWLRMPPALLIRHLLVKAWVRMKGDPATA